MEGLISSLPMALLLLLPVRLKAIRMLRVSTAIRHRRLICGGLLRVLSEWYSVATMSRAADTSVAGAALTQAHAGVSVVVVALWLCVPQTALVRLVVGIAALAGAAAHGEEPEQGSDDGEGGRDPSDGQGAGADVDFDLVRVEEAFQGAAESGEEDCRGETCGEGEQG